MTNFELEINKIIGLEACQKLIERFGGTRLRVPLKDNLEADHEISICIGYELAQKLCAYSGGDVLFVPLGNYGNRAKLWAKMTEYLDLGYSDTEIVHLLGVSLKTVENHRVGRYSDAKKAKFRFKQLSLVCD